MLTTSREASVLPPERKDWNVWRSEPWWDVWRCLKCEGTLKRANDHSAVAGGSPAIECPACGTTYRVEDNILILEDQTSKNNLVAREFYDSPLWPKFRFWERFTWFCNGGERRARNQVLKHLPQRPGLDLLDVAIGDGVYLDWLPKEWRIAGVDISWSQLEACRWRAAGRKVWLAQCEAEQLPLASRQFDAVLSIGAFNYFNDPEGSLREMVRVARPGAPIVISDEMPNLTNRMLGHKLGIPAFDRWFVSRVMHLGDPFTSMVEDYRDLNIQEIAGRVFPDFRFELVWRGLGYVLVGQAPG
ncbi:MAG: class I SAM-dependent methyltransferase [Isosphaeraceae bacterium]